ncbi:hypothetical protein [Catenovulum agarivorans]|uniref:hypothetical protein n=1 Tax=Catenovulum agarivorans TaxID=1172192 RepID=UPI00030F1765|nr:hypothetical protein [Catenovulum agarivorans]
MKNLATITSLVFLVPILGKQYLPEFFSLWYIQWFVLAAFMSLSILLPFGFAKCLLIPKYNQQAFLFLFLFLLVSALNAFGINGFDSIRTILTISNSTQAIPKQASIAAVEHEKADVREAMAKAIYIEHGLPVVYKDTSNELILYKPTAIDEQKYNERHIIVGKAKTLITQVTQQKKEAMYAVIWLHGSFFVIFLTTFIWGRRKSINQSTRDEEPKGFI